MYEFEITLKNGKTIIGWGYNSKDAATKAGINWEDVHGCVNLGYYD